MGDCQTDPLRPRFDRRLRLEFHGVKATSDDVPTGRGGSASGVVRGAPGSDRSAASGAEPRVIVRRGRMRVTSSREGWGWSAMR
jgi:hypothetical protein